MPIRNGWELIITARKILNLCEPNLELNNLISYIKKWHLGCLVWEKYPHIIRWRHFLHFLKIDMSVNSMCVSNTYGKGRKYQTASGCTFLAINTISKNLSKSLREPTVASQSLHPHGINGCSYLNANKLLVIYCYWGLIRKIEAEFGKWLLKCVSGTQRVVYWDKKVIFPFHSDQSMTYGEMTEVRWMWH